MTQDTENSDIHKGLQELRKNPGLGKILLFA
jgi:hypothetical protein